MVLVFENSGTCLIVKQYLDRCRNALRRELMDKFHTLLEPETSTVHSKVPMGKSGKSVNKHESPTNKEEEHVAV